MTANVQAMSKDELRAIVQRAYERSEMCQDVEHTAEEFAAAGELERRSIEAESAFMARVDQAGGEDAFDYAVRDADGFVGHAWDLVCDQFYNDDDACHGDYDAAWTRAMDCLASMQRVEDQRGVIDQPMKMTAISYQPSFAILRQSDCLNCGSFSCSRSTAKLNASAACSILARNGRQTI